MAAMLPRKASSGVFWARRGVVQARVARTKRFMKLAPVDSNHHSQIQSLVSCRWTRGQRDGKNLHYDPVRVGALHAAPLHDVSGQPLSPNPKLPKADVAAQVMCAPCARASATASTAFANAGAYRSSSS